MKQEFVPYELALKLKALGFDEPCFATWSGETLDMSLQIPSDDYFTKAPTFSQAFRWFREKHNIPFEIVCDNDYGLGYIRGYYPKIAVDSKNKTEPVYQNKDCFETYEEAELACLDKLIELTFKSE